jgi:hypothetical protein
LYFLLGNNIIHSNKLQNPIFFINIPRILFGSGIGLKKKNFVENIITVLLLFLFIPLEIRNIIYNLIIKESIIKKDQKEILRETLVLTKYYLYFYLFLTVSYSFLRNSKTRLNNQK